MSDYIPFQLEDFPNEILLEIFDYMRLNDLIRAFYNLNARFNSILFSSNIHLHILYPDDMETNSNNQKLLTDLIINQRFISRLRLTHDRDIPNKNFINLSHIRSLILDTPTPKLIEQIIPKNFPCLEYLRIGYISGKSQSSRLAQDIFSNAFPRLKKCSLNNILDNQQCTGSPFIRSLGIWSDNPRSIVERVLIALPNLLSLHLFLTWQETSVILDQPILHQHSYLKYLKLHLYNRWTMDKLDSFLAYIPTVINLSLYTSYFDAHMVDFHWDFHQLAYILLSRLPNLSYFACELIFRQPKFFSFNAISSFHNCFARIQYENFIEDDRFIRIFTE